MNSFALKRHPRFPGRPGPLLLVILDGVGIGLEDEADAVHLARTPTLDFLARECPAISLRAHGTYVGMPSDADMGNSEVGHNALGCGRIYDQGAKLVGKAIQTGAIFAGATWQRLIAHVRAESSALHLIGLVSDGNVHAHIDHLVALLRGARAQGVERIFVHALLDGRDVPDGSALVYLDRLQSVLAETGARIASGGGRMVVTMDRYEADWTIVKRGFDAHVHGDARRFPDARAAITTFRAESPGISDQTLPPFVIATEKGEPIGPIRDGDAVIFFNFRGDRAIEISRAFEEGASFTSFDRAHKPDVFYAGMMQYDGDFGIPKHYLVSPPAIDRTMGEYLVENKVPQLAIAETQKYGHVTYFWNGNRGGMFDTSLETYVEIRSDRLPFEERPWMKAAEVTDRLIDELNGSRYGFLRVNFANGDMVGHTGARDAAIIAIECLDLQIARLLPAVKALSGIMIVTADHGNAEEMYEHDKKGAVVRDKASGRPVAKTSHTLNPVPFYVFDPLKREDEYHLDTALSGKTSIARVTATCMNLLGFESPADEEPSLLKFP